MLKVIDEVFSAPGVSVGLEVGNDIGEPVC
jgi:hypothetical protein